MDTTGAIIIAKNDHSHKNLARQFKEHSALKTYRAVVWGAVKNDEGIISLPIGRSSTHRKKMSTGAQKSRTALTRWRVLKRYPGLTLIQLTPETGRTHQLRVHLSAINHPVVGDKTYGLKKARPELSKTALDKIKGVKRQLLHAYSLEITHPATGKRMEFIAEVPEDMQELINFLDSTC
jgi:23S rRNA pseudouridine1911/1915/1917 synthase